MKKITALILAAMLLLASCASNPTEEADKTENPGTDGEVVVEEAAEEDEVKAPDLPRFNGDTFTFGVVDNANARNAIVMEELTGEALNDAQYTTVLNTNDALNVEIAENLLTNGYPAANALIPFITAGDDVIQIANVFCVDALTLMSSAYIRSYDDLENINLDNPWWDAGVNDSLTFAGIRYAAIGDLSVATNDLTYALLFSDKLVTDYALESPYSLVFEGKWTMDKMREMMETVLLDVNGNGERDADDVYGYLAAPKMVLPAFWIGANEKSLETDPETGLPTLALDDERFNDVFNKVYEMTYDNGARYEKITTDFDVPTECRNMFMNDKSLFLDCSFFWVGTLREMENDYGFIPYPKYDENQTDYCVRVSYYMPPVIPVTSVNMALTGAVLEETNYQAMKNIKPAYYEITLKGKYARDPESVKMLDLIFESRVVDLGDTLFCASIRDGFISAMYNSDDRNLASKVKTQTKVINKQIQKAAESITNAVNGQG